MTAPWTVTTTPGSPVLVTVAVTPSPTAADRDALLSDGIVDLVGALVAAATGADPVVVDIRCQIDDPGSSRAVEAYIDAARGLVQSFVLERTGPVGPVNLVVSVPNQDADRDATFTYLGSPDGRFSWGAGYDLREDAS